MSKYYVGKPKRHGTYTGAGGPTGPIPAPSNTGPAQVTEGQGMSDDGEKLAMSSLKKEQDLIIPGRRVWHEATGDIVGESRRSWNEIRGEFNGGYLPILTAVEVREQPVGAVLVDTLTGEDCRTSRTAYNESLVLTTETATIHITHNTPDRDLENRFALKTLPTEET